MNSRRLFLSISAIVFVASSAATIAWCASMSAMGIMEMPGGWAMSMMWMRMPGQSWPGASAGFVAMWVVMMVAMMLPSLSPTLWRYRQSLGMAGGARIGSLMVVVGAAYFAVWLVLGVIVFAVGSVVADIAMRDAAAARAVPVLVGAVVLAGSGFQFSAWKARKLALCRAMPTRHLTSWETTGGAWRHGWCLGLHCVQSCAGLTVVVLALGMMDLRVMAAVATVITAERLAPSGVGVARASGIVGIVLGLAEIARAAGVQ